MSVVFDKATAFKNELTGSTTNKIVCKASSHEIAGPKKKHVDFLIQLTNDPQCSLTTLADLINDRMRNSSWVVVFKALIVSHNLMTLGNERYLQCLATRTTNFPMESFSDRSDAIGADMTAFVRRYAKYLGYTCTAYRMQAMDVCRIQKGENSPFRTMEPAKLLKASTVVQEQIDYLLEIEVTAGELTNGVINTGFLMLYKDLIKLYAVYNDSLINLLEKFFEMKKQQCRETMEVYRKFLTRQDGVQKFLQLAEEVGVDRQSHLNLRQVPEDLLPALESHLSEMDSIKKAVAQPSPAIKAASEKLAKLRETTTEKAVSPVTPPTSPAQGLPSASNEVLEAQKKRFEELKQQAQATKSSPETDRKSTHTATRPIIKKTSLSDMIEKSPEDIEFDKIAVSSASHGTKQPSMMDDLLGLEGFTSVVTANRDPWSHPVTSQPQPVAANNPFAVPSSTATTIPPGTSDPWSTQNTASGYQEVDLFTEIRGGQPDFDSIFGQGPAQYRPPPSAPMGNSLGEILLPVAIGPHTSQPDVQPQEYSRLTQDVETSLISAAQNLSLDLSTGTRTGLSKKTEHQWKPPSDPIKTGGPNWQRQLIQPKTLPPSSQPSAVKGGGPVNWNTGMYSGHFPVQSLGQQPYMMQQPQPAVWQAPQQQQQDPFGPIGAQPARLF